ncbi:retrovirus-related pol polyprotein from transposon TNT 1-94 [Tanacetum coccineum]
MEAQDKRKKHFARLREEEQRRKPPTKAQKRSDELEQEKAKKQKIDDDQEEVEIRKLIEIVPDEEDVAIDATSLATKPPIISIDREDLETLWKLVKAKHGNTRPKEGYERVLWGDLKVMFEPDVESEVWRNLQGHKVTVWKLFSSSGVNLIRFQTLHIFMLVEKKYPLTPATITEILNKKVQANHWNEMCYQLLKLMTKQLKNPGSGRIVRIKSFLMLFGINTAKVRVTAVKHNEDGNPARANVKQALGRLRFALAFWLLKTAFWLLRFASRFGCVLLKTSIAFCLKTILRFDKKLLWQNFILHCVLSRLLHCVLPNNSDDIQAAGSDTRPPMLDRTDYESWSQRIRLYCRGKENGLKILQSIDQGPFKLRTTRDALGTTPEGGVLLGPERPRTYEDLSDTEKKRYDADVRATNIVLQGLPKDIYKLINHNIEAKAIWDNVKMLLAGSELTKEDRESQLYDEFERFKMLPGENINEYYVRFHKLVNDMRNIRMTMPNIQLNSKFVNNMSPEWDRFVTAVKLNKGLKETNHEQLYAYLKQHEKHAAQDRLIIERITPATNDQLAFVSTVQPHAQSSHVQSHQYPSSSTNPQSPQYPQFPETSQIDSGYTQTDELLDNLTKQMALLAQSFRATLPQTNNQLRTSSNTRNQATIQDGRVVVQNVQGRQNQNQRYFARGNGTAGNGGAQNRAGNANAGQGKPVKCYNCNGVGHIARNCTQPKRPQNSDYFKDKMLLMQAQENGAVLDEEELLFLAGEQGNTFDADVDNQPVQDLALNEDNIFQADECDAFDSDVDDEPTAQSIFMANLSSVGSANPQAGPSNASILSEIDLQNDLLLDLDNAFGKLGSAKRDFEVWSANKLELAKLQKTFICFEYQQALKERSAHQLNDIGQRITQIVFDRQRFEAESQRASDIKTVSGRIADLTASIRRDIEVLSIKRKDFTREENDLTELQNDVENLKDSVKCHQLMKTILDLKQNADYVVGQTSTASVLPVKKLKVMFENQPEIVELSKKLSGLVNVGNASKSGALKEDHENDKEMLCIRSSELSDREKKLRKLANEVNQENESKTTHESYSKRIDEMCMKH